MMLSRKLWRLSTSHSQKFCAPSGTSLISRVATCAKTMIPSATNQVKIIEFVTSIGPSLIRDAAGGRPSWCSSCAPGSAAVTCSAPTGLSSAARNAAPPKIHVSASKSTHNRGQRRLTKNGRFAETGLLISKNGSGAAERGAGRKRGVGEDGCRSTLRAERNGIKQRLKRRGKRIVKFFTNVFRSRGEQRFEWENAADAKPGRNWRNRF